MHLVVRHKVVVRFDFRPLIRRPKEEIKFEPLSHAFIQNLKEIIGPFVAKYQESLLALLC